jgi:hypothetical protein
MKRNPSHTPAPFRSALMERPKRARVSLLLVLAALTIVGRVEADETLLCHHHIVAVPFTITAPGHYCLGRNITTSMTGGTAIRINADFVWLDLNNFTLDGTPGGTAADTVGIGMVGTVDHRHITVRNGIVRGFLDGINLYGGVNGSNYTIEGIWADGNYVNGIAVRGLGGGHVVRDNVVTNTGGTTLPEFTGGAPNASVGISAVRASTILNNQVTHTFNHNINGRAVAFDLAFEGEGQIAVNNRVTGSENLGFQCGDTPISNVFLRDNIVVGTPVAYSQGCVKIGTTNFP